MSDQNMDAAASELGGSLGFEAVSYPNALPEQQRTAALRLSRAMHLSVSEGALATVMGTLLGGAFLTGFAIEIGASRLQIGIMAALPTLCNSAQFIGASVLNRTGRAKGLCMAATWASRLLWLPILCVPSLLSNWSGEVQAWCVIGIFALANALGSIGGLAWLDWIKRLIPEERRIAFLARRNLVNSGLSLAMSVAAALLISFWQQPTSQSTQAFLMVFGMAMTCGLIGTILLGRIPHADSLDRTANDIPVNWHEPLSSSNYRQLLTGFTVWQFASQLAAPFYVVYMLQRLNVPFWAVTSLATMGSLTALTLNGMWTRMKLRFGVRPVVLLAMLGDVAIPFCWLMVHPQSVWMVIPLHLLAMFNPPLAMGPNNMLLKLAPARGGVSYFALFNATTGTLGALGAVVGGWLAMTLQGQWSFGQVELTGIQLVFLLSGLGKLIGIGLLSNVVEPGAVTLKDTVRICFAWRSVKPALSMVHVNEESKLAA